MPDFLLHWITAYGTFAIFGFLVLGVFGLPVPDETLLTFAGVLVRQNRLEFAPTWLAAALGSMAGISLSYVMGRTAGLALVLRYGRWFHVTREELQRVETWLARRGKWTLTFGYFIPGVRHLTAVVAGSTELPFKVFAAHAYSGAAAWSLTFILLGWYVGDRWRAALDAVHRHTISVMIVLAIGGAGYAAFRWFASRKPPRGRGAP